MFRILFKSIIRISLILLILLLIKTFLLQPFFMLDSGMQPTLKENRLYAINKITYRFEIPERGDIIFFRATDDPPLFFIARVVALPGETFEIRKGRVFIDGKPLRKNYTKINSNWNLDKIKIKQNCFYVLCDNRQISLAVHLHTQVAFKNILGKVMGKR